MLDPEIAASSLPRRRASRFLEQYDSRRRRARRYQVRRGCHRDVRGLLSLPLEENAQVYSFFTALLPTAALSAISGRRARAILPFPSMSQMRPRACACALAWHQRSGGKSPVSQSLQLSKNEKIRPKSEEEPYNTNPLLQSRGAAINSASPDRPWYRISAGF